MGQVSTYSGQQTFTLRTLEKGDMPAVIRQLNDPRIAPWLAAIPQPFDQPAVDALLAHAQHPGEDLRILEQDGAVAGCLCIGASVWYWLNPAYWGRGLMRQALQTAIAAHFSTPASPLTATCHEDNAASRGLLARLGFSQVATAHNMFFHSRASKQPCRDFLMTPEQWHLLHPPLLTLGSVTLRPAKQKDAPVLARMLPHAGSSLWPTVETLQTFIETHRFRGPPKGLFVIIDSNRRSIGMALLTDTTPTLRFLADEENARHRDQVNAALAQWVGSAQPFRCE